MAAAVIPNQVSPLARATGRGGTEAGSDRPPPVLCPQSAVERVSSLPLVSSTYGLVSTVYSSTKDTHPYIRTVCEAAELGVRSITSAVFTTASPIIDRLEPQSTSPALRPKYVTQKQEVHARMDDAAVSGSVSVTRHFCQRVCVLLCRLQLPWRTTWPVRVWTGSRRPCRSFTSRPSRYAPNQWDL